MIILCRLLLLNNWNKGQIFLNIALNIIYSSFTLRQFMRDKKKQKTDNKLLSKLIEVEFKTTLRLFQTNFSMLYLFIIFLSRWSKQRLCNRCHICLGIEEVSRPSACSADASSRTTRHRHVFTLFRPNCSLEARHIREYYA